MSKGEKIKRIKVNYNGVEIWLTRLQYIKYRQLYNEQKRKEIQVVNFLTEVLKNQKRDKSLACI